MRHRWTGVFSIVLPLMLIALILAPGEKAVESPAAFLAVVLLIMAFGLLMWRFRRVWNSDLLCLVWTLLLVWELCTTKLNVMHPVLVPAPEDVFHVYITQYPLLLRGIVSSLQLLLVGGVLGVCLGVLLGLLVGWTERLRALFFPIAQVMAPISPIIYAPYLIALMPSFRSASMLIIFLGVFLPMFLNTIIRVGAVEQRILDSARALCVSDAAMIFRILLPSLLPGIIGGLKVTLATSFMLLTFAEMMGATSGMGYYIINYAHYANYTNVIAGIFLMGMVIILLNKLLERLQAIMIPWK
ncbi:MAG: ABC transporter permease [Christensenellales bacterium]|jgi:NitT/TauT family transport system permease protein